MCRNPKNCHKNDHDNKAMALSSKRFNCTAFDAFFENLTANKISYFNSFDILQH